MWRPARAAAARYNSAERRAAADGELRAAAEAPAKQPVTDYQHEERDSHSERDSYSLNPGMDQGMSVDNFLDHSVERIADHPSSAGEPRKPGVRSVLSGPTSKVTALKAASPRSFAWSSRAETAAAPAVQA